MFIRAGLLLEFKMLQRAVNVNVFANNSEVVCPDFDPKASRTDRKMIADHYKRLIDDKLLNEKLFSTAIFLCKEPTSEIQAKRLLKQMSRFYYHKRMFGGTQGSWLGTLGAFYIEANRYEGFPRAIYYESDNSRTISEEIKEMFLERGFSVSARSLYLRHKAIKKECYAKIRYYYNRVLELPYIPAWYLNKNDLYDLALAHKEENINK